MAKRSDEPRIPTAEDVLFQMEQFPWGTIATFAKGMTEMSDARERQKLVDVARLSVPAYVKLNLELDGLDTALSERISRLLMRPFEEVLMAHGLIGEDDSNG